MAVEYNEYVTTKLTKIAEFLDLDVDLESIPQETIKLVIALIKKIREILQV